MPKSNLVKLKTPVKVNLWGHEAQISDISWRRKLEPWLPNDELLVWFNLSEPAYGTWGFGISLPVRDYGKSEFLQVAIEEGERRLQEKAARRKEEIEKQEQEEERGEELDMIVQNIVNRLAEET